MFDRLLFLLMNIPSSSLQLNNSFQNSMCISLVHSHLLSVNNYLIFQHLSLFKSTFIFAYVLYMYSFSSLDSKKFTIEKNLKHKKKHIYFLLNIFRSLWDYTNVVMNFVFGARTMDGNSSLSLDWLQHFDFVITGRLCFLHCLKILYMFNI